MSGRQLCSKLKEFDIVTRSVKINGYNTSGFKFEQFNDAFARYLDNDYNHTEQLYPSDTSSAEPTNLLHNKINEIRVVFRNFDEVRNDAQPTSNLLNLNESRLVGCENGVSGENKGGGACREEWL